MFLVSGPDLVVAAASAGVVGAFPTLNARTPEILDAWLQDIAARSAGEIEDAAAAIRASGGSAEALALDVTDVAAMRAALGARPAFDVLVNNAGGARHAPFLDVTEADYDAILDLNLRSAFFVMQQVARGMMAAGLRGSIVNLSSQMGHVGGPKRSVYCATKFAIEGLTKAMAVELAPDGIRVVAVAPTFVLTPMTEGMFADPAFRAMVMDMIPLRKLATPEDVAAAVVFLASDDARMITGDSLKIDGGWTAR